MAITDYSYVDYLEQSISSIDVVQKLSKDQVVQLNLRQCEYLSDKLTETACFLRAKSESLISIRDSTDIRRKSLLQLHFAVKRAEKLVRDCCCENKSWLESAVTLSRIKEDIKDILLDLRWWTSMIDIAIASVTWMSSGQEKVLKLLTRADEDYGKLLDNLHMSNNDLDRAASKDEDLLLRKVRDVETLYAGVERTAEQKHDYLLAVHVRSRLENSEVETMEELNAYDECSLIGMGGFGAVMNVRWFGRRCALKTLKQKCKKEATSLSEFQHPHIVKFFRYWEAPFAPSTHVTPHATPQSTTGSGNSMQAYATLQSHILMELLPMDLAQHLKRLRNMVNFTVDSKRKPEDTRGSPMPEDVALDVMLQMVKAMWHLNSRDVAHRDLKPNNVLVRPVSDDEVPELNYRGYLRAKLADFGLAKTRALSSASSTQPALGTKVYGAPEVFSKDIISVKKYPRKADVWSLGIMFCEILSGKPPFPGVEDQTLPLGELQGRIKKGLRPRIPENCPEYLKFIIESCWELLPQDRPSFSDLWKLIRLAQVRSLGLIQKDYDLFTYRTRNGVRSLHPSIRKTPAPAPEPLVQPKSLEGGLKESSGSSIWWIMIRWISYNLTRSKYSVHVSFSSFLMFEK
jgi:serine/threonine protein kinase